MRISKKCQYALRAVFELALRNTGKPVKIHDIAAAQGIPPRFLEVILNQLRHEGYVESRRGNEGGYMLVRGAEKLTVGEVIGTIEGPVSIAGDESDNYNKGGSFFGGYAFEQLWEKVNSAVKQVWDNTTIAELVKYEMSMKNESVPNYVI